MRLIATTWFWRIWWWGIILWHLAYLIYLHQFGWAAIPLGFTWFAGILTIEPSLRHFEKLKADSPSAQGVP